MCRQKGHMFFHLIYILSLLVLLNEDKNVGIIGELAPLIVISICLC